MQPINMTDKQYLGYRKSYLASLIKQVALPSLTYRFKIHEIISMDLEQVESHISYYKEIIRNEKGEQKES